MKNKIRVIENLREDESEYQKLFLDEPFYFESGEFIPSVDIAYETYGKLNEDGTNAILICHALTGDSHASNYNNPNGREGWWDGAIGKDKAFDPEKYFIVCSNFLGSCYGTTGPASVMPNSTNEETKFLPLQKYNLSFPQMTIRDMVNLQYKLIQHLGIKKIKTIAGGSMGGMQALEWSIMFPELVESIIPIACGARHSAWAIGLNEIQRKAIIEDPKWNNGNYLAQPSRGLTSARMLAMMTYRSNKNFQSRFARNIRQQNNQTPYYEVESYLHYQGQKLVSRFDANTYLYITRAMDFHDLSRGRDSLENVLGKIKSKTLVIGIDTDLLYPTNEQKEIARLIPNAKYAEIKTVYGHDAFLIEFEQLNEIVKDFLD